MKKPGILQSTLLGAALLAVPSLVSASGEVTPTPTAAPTPVCESSYGGYGQQTCDRVDFIIDKKVADPITVGKKTVNPSNYQDNFAINNNKYVPGQEVPFQITIKNTGTKTLKDVVVKDTLPEHVTPVSPKDNYNKDTRELTIKVGTLKANETKVVEITVKLNAADKLPDQSQFCLTNKATAYAEDKNVSDESQFCVEKEKVGGPDTTKGGLPVHDAPNVKETPPTGPAALALIPLMGSGIAGFILRRKSQ